MLEVGADAPAVRLPAYADGERRPVDLDEHIGEGIVVLAFYPADFSPGCTMRESDLGDLDIFTMQKDISVFGVSPDSTYSHEAFAERYSLHIPLLSDRDGEAASAYDVTLDTATGERLAQRAVFVIDHRGEIRYAWATDDLAELPDMGPVKETVGEIGGDATAYERYRVGHKEYVDGREAFTAAMSAYQSSEWLMARNHFNDAQAAFDAAADDLDTSVRFAETEDFETVVDRAQEKADTLRHAAQWLGEATDAFASGSGATGQQYREDAEPLLEAAREVGEPPEPEKFEVGEDGILVDDVTIEPEDDAEGYDWQKADEGDREALEAEEEALDAAVDAAESAETEAVNDAAAAADAASSVGDDTIEGDLEMDVEGADADGHTDRERSTPEADGSATTSEPDATDEESVTAAPSGDGHGGHSKDKPDAKGGRGRDDSDGTVDTTGDGGSGSSDDTAGSDIEGDTVEGDLDMDLDAIEAELESADESGDEAGETVTESDPQDEQTSAQPTASTDTAGRNTGPGDTTTPDRTGEPTDDATGEASGPDPEADDAAESMDPPEELDLTDPTADDEADGEDDETETADEDQDQDEWNGRARDGQL